MDRGAYLRRLNLPKEGVGAVLNRRKHLTVLLLQIHSDGLKLCNEEVRHDDHVNDYAHLEGAQGDDCLCMGKLACSFWGHEEVLRDCDADGQAGEAEQNDFKVGKLGIARLNHFLGQLLFLVTCKQRLHHVVDVAARCFRDAVTFVVPSSCRPRVHTELPLQLSLVCFRQLLVEVDFAEIFISCQLGYVEKGHSEASVREPGVCDVAAFLIFGWEQTRCFLTGEVSDKRASIRELRRHEV